MAQEDYKAKTERLNELLAEMKAKFVEVNLGASTGPLYNQRVKDLHKAAAEVHAAIKTILNGDCEVWAHEGRAHLKMGSVGPIRHTGFPCNRAPYWNDWETDSGLIEKCELILIDEFSCHPPI